jgi:hypothetical protein
MGSCYAAGPNYFSFYKNDVQVLQACINEERKIRDSSFRPD